MDIPMTPRLLKIAEYVEKGERLADIGTDHAYIPIYLVQNGIVNEAVAADVNRAPLETASENIKSAGLENKIKTVLSDGFFCIEEDSFDTAVIAGMGGMLIADILKNAPRGKKYILQPMKNLPELKRFLSENRYKVTAECLANEDGKLYNILAVQDGEQTLSEIELYIGKGLEKDELLPMYKEKLYAKFQKIIKGNEAAENPDRDLIEHYEELLKKVKV